MAVTTARPRQEGAPAGALAGAADLRDPRSGQELMYVVGARRRPHTPGVPVARAALT